MFGDINRVEIMGNITNDLQLRYTGGGAAVLSFSVATNRRYKSQQENEWKEEVAYHNIVVWGNQAEMLADRAHKGTRIYVEGRLQTRTWDDADGKKNYKTEINSSKIILIDRYDKKSGDQAIATDGEEPARSSKPSPQKSKVQESVIDPDDLPF